MMKMMMMTRSRQEVSDPPGRIWERTQSAIKRVARRNNDDDDDDYDDDDDDYDDDDDDAPNQPQRGSPEEMMMMIMMLMDLISHKESWFCVYPFIWSVCNILMIK